MGAEAAWGSFAPKGMLRRLLDTTASLPTTWFGKRAFYTLRRLGRMNLAGKPVDVVRFGAKLRLNADHNVCEGRILFNPDFFDYRERKFLDEHLPEAPVFIDAGANIGGYSFYVCQVRPKAQAIAIEAQENTFKKLFFNVAQNPDMRIQAVNCALSDKNGTISLFVNEGNNGETSIRVTNGSQKTVEVTATTLLTIAQNFNLDRIDALKMDIEGAEDFVLKAFFETAPQHLFPKLILIENSQSRWDFDVVRYIEDQGYRQIRNFKGNVALERN